MYSLHLRRKAVLLLAVLLAFALAACSKASAPETASSSVAYTPSPTGAASSSPGPASSGVRPSPSPSAKPTSSAPQGKVTALRLADEKSGWAGGEGWIARTDDGGKSWRTQLEHPYVVNQLFALNGKEAWAAFDIGSSKALRLMHTTDGGQTWTEAGEMPGRGFLHFVSSKEAFSGNEHTTDGGRTWTRLNVPASIAGEAYFHDRSNGWAVAQKQSSGEFSVMRTTDGGHSWTAVFTRASAVPINGVVIRSAGSRDAWVQLIGDSGMSQTSYSLFHTADGGRSWTAVVANNQAGSGLAPGFKMDEKTTVPRNNGTAPGPLYVVNPKAAFMGGQCPACDLPNTIGKTTDGGRTWVNLPGEFAGYGPQLIAAADADHVWRITTDNTAPSVLYTSSNGGKSWSKAHTFDKPKP
jgi:photosystem II stability/assembly factor-like uncharacterized protein